LLLVALGMLVVTQRDASTHRLAQEHEASA
jgi:hypothetical protein